MSTDTPAPQASPALLQRVRDILLRPQPTWQQIDGEDGSPAHVYRNYLVFLAAIPAVAAFIGNSLVGASLFGMTYRVPVGQGLASMVVGYVMSLVIIYLMAMIANALAPRYQGRKDMGSALKLIAYGSTAGMVAGVFSLVPALAVLGVLGGIYSIYLIYKGIPVLMKAPQERARTYTIVLVICGAIAALVLGGIMAVFSPSPTPPLAGVEHSAPGKLEIPGTGVTIDTSRLEEAARKIESVGKDGGEAGVRAATDAVSSVLGGILGQKAADTDDAPVAAAAPQAPAPAGDRAAARASGATPSEERIGQAQRRLEEAQARGDSAGVEAAMKEMVQATFGSAAALSTQQLREQMPEALAGLARASMKTQSRSTMGIESSELNAVYGEGQNAVRVQVQDMGAAGGALSSLMVFAGGTSESEDDESKERSYREDELFVQEKFRKDGSQAHIEVILPGGVQVKADGAVAMDELRPGIMALVKSLQALPRPTE